MPFRWCFAGQLPSELGTAVTELLPLPLEKDAAGVAEDGDSEQLPKGGFPWVSSHVALTKVKTPASFY